MHIRNKTSAYLLIGLVLLASCLKPEFKVDPPKGVDAVAVYSAEGLQIYDIGRRKVKRLHQLGVIGGQAYDDFLDADEIVSFQARALGETIELIKTGQKNIKDVEAISKELNDALESVRNTIGKLSPGAADDKTRAILVVAGTMVIDAIRIVNLIRD